MLKIPWRIPGAVVQRSYQAHMLRLGYIVHDTQFVEVFVRLGGNSAYLDNLFFVWLDFAVV